MRAILISLCVNADSPLDGQPRLYLTVLVHDAARVRQTRALTSTTEQTDRSRSSGASATRTRVAGQLSLVSCPSKAGRVRVSCLGLRGYGHGIIMSMLAHSERIIVDWLEKNPFLLDLSPVERAPPSVQWNKCGSGHESW